MRSVRMVGVSVVGMAGPFGQTCPAEVLDAGISMCWCCGICQRSFRHHLDTTRASFQQRSFQTGYCWTWRSGAHAATSSLVALL